MSYMKCWGCGIVGLVRADLAISGTELYCRHCGTKNFFPETAPAQAMELALPAPQPDPALQVLEAVGKVLVDKVVLPAAEEFGKRAAAWAIEAIFGKPPRRRGRRR